jgi:hypothetical protein
MMLEFRITFVLYYTMGKAQRWGTFSKCGVALTWDIMVGHNFSDAPLGLYLTIGVSSYPSFPPMNLMVMVQKFNEKHLQNISSVYGGHLI